MKILEYAEFSRPRNLAQYDKVRQAIERGDFRSADVKKLANLAHGKLQSSAMPTACCSPPFASTERCTH
jgi:hypothetical protein